MQLGWDVLLLLVVIAGIIWIWRTAHLRRVYKIWFSILLGIAGSILLAYAVLTMLLIGGIT